MKQFHILFFLFIASLSLKGQNSSSFEYYDSRRVKIEFSKLGRCPSELLPLIKSKVISSLYFVSDTSLRSGDEKYDIIEIKREAKDVYHLRILTQRNYYIGVSHYQLITTSGEEKKLQLKELKFLYGEV